MYVYLRSEPGLWTVGYYTPYDKWIAESDHSSSAAAALRVAWLNGDSDYRDIADALNDSRDRNQRLAADLATAQGRIAELETQLAATLTTIEAALPDGRTYAEGCAP